MADGYSEKASAVSRWLCSDGTQLKSTREHKATIQQWLRHSSGWTFPKFSSEEKFEKRGWQTFQVLDLAF